MADKNTEKKHQAQFLYMAGGKTQKEIADLVGVSERAVHAWIHQYAWDKLRLAAFQAPVTIADNLSSQIVELQNAIAAREPGNRYPTTQEAEVMRKLISSWERMKKHPSLSVHMQVLETFRNYIRPVDKQFAAHLGRYTEQFIGAKSVNGYAPYQPEYGLEPVSPILPGYDEADGLDENEPPYREACVNLDTCLHPGDCGHPRCHTVQKRNVTVDDYKVTPVQFMRANIPQNQPAVAAEATGSISATAEHKTETGIQLPVTPALSDLQSESNGAGFVIPAAKAEQTRSNSAVFTSDVGRNESEIIPQNDEESNSTAQPEHMPQRVFLCGKDGIENAGLAA